MRSNDSEDSPRPRLSPENGSDEKDGKSKRRWLKKACCGISFAGVMGLAYLLLVFLPAKCTKEATDAITEVHGSWLNDFAEGCKDIFGLIPDVTEEGVMILEGDKQISELNVLQKRFTYTYTWTHEGFLWSTKKIRLEGSFLAKAGYDLKKPFRVDVSTDGGIVRTYMPDPQLNSLELQRYRVLIEEDGWFNDLSRRNREYCVNRMIGKARTYILNTSLLSRVDKSFQDQLDDIIRSEIPHAEIVVHQPAHH